MFFAYFCTHIFYSAAGRTETVRGNVAFETKK